MGCRRGCGISWPRPRRGEPLKARLATIQERLRFARDVHDLLGHNLSVIALRAELAARLAPVDAERAAQEAAEVQRLAASALADMREAMYGYRAVDLREQLAAVAQVLRSSGVRCTVTQPTGELPSEIAIQLAPVLREASTNVLRHSKARLVHHRDHPARERGVHARGHRAGGAVIRVLLADDEGLIRVALAALL